MNLLASQVGPVIKALKGELSIRRRKNLVQSRSFAAMLEQSMRRHQNQAIEAAQVNEELIELARELWEADARGEQLGLPEDELAFCDALETNDSVVQVLGDETLREIARAGRHRTQGCHDRLGYSGECARPISCYGPPCSAQILVSTGKADEGYTDGAGTGELLMEGWAMA